MSVFVLEIGSEELPARFLTPAEAELATRLGGALEAAGVGYAQVRTMSTPRRLIALVENIETVQQEREEIVTGPPIRAAYDAQGAPTKALEGFAKTHGVAVQDVFTEQTPKGEYIAVRKRTGGAKTLDLLAQICPEVIGALPFAKRMRWGDNAFAYARPLRWIVALLDAEVVPFTVGPVSSGRQTAGHRIHSSAPDGGMLSVPDAMSWEKVIREQGGVEPDAARRRASIIDGGNAQAASVRGKILWKDSLLDEVQGLCEHPVPMLGSFDTAYLEVPREVLLTSMESHQKSFGVEDASGTLLPHFLTVLNLDAQEPALVRKGWERVLRARLEDARFFWRSDLAEDFTTWLERLDAVIFLGPLGSMGDKTRRLEQLCLWLAGQVGFADAQSAARAGRLSKADLVSGMVGEFDTLQGIMGGIYAQKRGEQACVATALKEQYLPAGPESPLPASVLGAIVSIADKADTLVGCFGLGMIPTGTADPNALRRCALGITRIMEAFTFRFDVRELFAQAHSLYGERAWKLSREESLTKLYEFFVSRMKYYLLLGDADTLLADAVLNADGADVWAACQRFVVLQGMQKDPRFTTAAQTFKRVTNIIRKQGQTNTVLTGAYTPALLAEDADKAFAAALERLLPRLDTLQAKDDFAAIAEALLVLRPDVDAFFDGVMVMCDDSALRQNRLNMLYALLQRIERFADFAALQV